MRIRALTRRLAPPVLLVLVSTLVSVGFAEVMFRVYAEYRFRHKSRVIGNMIPVRGAQVFALKPNTSGDAPAGDGKHMFPFRTNAHGLRDRDRPGKASGTTRVDDDAARTAGRRAHACRRPRRVGARQVHEGDGEGVQQREDDVLE